MVVKFLIDKVEYPTTIRGRKDEKFTIKVIGHTEGDGENYIYLELWVNGVKLVDVTSEEPVSPDQSVEVTIELTVLEDLPRGLTLSFDVYSGHLVDKEKVRDDSESFAITVTRPIPWWLIAVGVGVPLVAIGVAVRRR